MVAKLCGYRGLDFNSEDGKNIKGTQLFVSYNESTVVGQATGKFFVKPEIKIPNVKPGDSIRILFDHKGKVESVLTAE